MKLGHCSKNKLQAHRFRSTSINSFILGYPKISNIPKAMITIPIMKIESGFRVVMDAVDFFCICIFLNRKTGRIIAIIASIMPAKFKIFINAFGTAIATIAGGITITRVEAKWQNLSFVMIFFRSFFRTSFSDKPTPMIEVKIASNEIIHAAY